MQPWQLAFLGQHELPRELTAFELGYFFSFNDAERRAIRTRRRPLNQLGAARLASSLSANPYAVVFHDPELPG